MGTFLPSPPSVTKRKGVTSFRPRVPAPDKALNAPTPKTKKGCLMAALPEGVRKELTDWAAEHVLEDHLGIGGREASPHVTVLHGFPPDFPEEEVEWLTDYLKNFGPLRLTLGGLGLFRGNDDGDVLKLEVDSPDLHELHHELKELFYVETKFPEFLPHVTLAYLDPAAADLYVEEAHPFAGREVLVEETVFSSAAKVRTTMPLSALPRSVFGPLATPVFGVKELVNGTGIDKLGREWRAGKLVPKKDEQSTQDQSNSQKPAETPAGKAPESPQGAPKTPQDGPAAKEPAPESPQGGSGEPEAIKAEAAKAANPPPEEAEVAEREFPPEQAEAEKQWHSEFLSYLAENPAAKPTEAQAPAVSRLLTGFLNKTVSGSAYLVGLAERFVLDTMFVDEETHETFADALAAVNRLSIAGDNSKASKALAGLVTLLGPVGVSIARRLADKFGLSEEQQAAKEELYGKWEELEAQLKQAQTPEEAAKFKSQIAELKNELKTKYRAKLRIEGPDAEPTLPQVPESGPAPADTAPAEMSADEDEVERQQANRNEVEEPAYAEEVKEEDVPEAEGVEEKPEPPKKPTPPQVKPKQDLRHNPDLDDVFGKRLKSHPHLGGYVRLKLSSGRECWAVRLKPGHYQVVNDGGSSTSERLSPAPADIVSEAPASFDQKLVRMVENSKLDKALSWQDSGSGGDLVKPPEFSLKALRAKYRAKDADPRRAYAGQHVQSTLVNGASVRKVVSEVAVPRDDEQTPNVAYRWEVVRNGRVVSVHAKEREALLVASAKGVGSSLQSAGSWLARKWASLEGRYGRTRALILAAAQLSPVPFVGTALIAVAELERRLRGYSTDPKVVAEVEGAMKSLPRVPRVKTLSGYAIKKKTGTCKQGERSDLTGCQPAEGESGSPKEKPVAKPTPTKKAPGSQVPEGTKERLKELGMVGTLPPADVPVSEIKYADLSGDPEELKFKPLMQWNQTTKSGRVSRQYRYTQEFHDRNAAAKFARVTAVEPHLQEATKALAARMADQQLSERERDAAAIANIIAETGLRPTDGDESVQHGHFGIASLQARHVKVVGDEVHLDFIGKEGVRNRSVVRDPANVMYLKAKLGQAKGKNPLWSAASSDAGAVLKEVVVAAGGPEDVKLKDLRTIRATQKAREVVESFKGPPPPLTGDEKKDVKIIAKAVLAMSGEVAKILNNQATMARDNYINPEVFRSWQQQLQEAS